ncbi:UNKNOWN [Stylonychia lemnae]|uniref:Uncharacterized protein n=1 Tax=Stylonychia lemnae TaxID=5949 RepID=A0A078ADM5_STYLE|nr:UNKNOWN [Stylonychia lemnae]|eukprot:CDW80340.1 UNKNOWN [Stylonychia lemnae]
MKTNQPKKLNDEQVYFDFNTETTPMSTKNIPLLNKNLISAGGCGKVQNEDSCKQQVQSSSLISIQNSAMSYCQQQQINNGSFLTNANLKVQKKNSTNNTNLAGGIVASQNNPNVKINQNREGSVVSDKANNSLIKLKSRNRPNENLNAGGDTTQNRLKYQAMLENYTQNSNARIILPNQDNRSFQPSCGKVIQETWQSVKASNNLNESNASLERQISDNIQCQQMQHQNQQSSQTRKEKIESIKELQKMIMANEPQSCQNKLQKDKPMLLKNFQQTQKQSNSQVATPKYLKFKQQTTTNPNKNINSFVTTTQTQQNNVPLKRQDSSQQERLQQDTSQHKSPMQQQKGGIQTLNKVSIRNSSHKLRDYNVSSTLETSWIFSNEKGKMPQNKSAEEERDEMSTTINCTTNNEASMFPEEIFPNQNQCSPVQNLSMIYQNFQSQQQNPPTQLLQQPCQSKPSKQVQINTNSAGQRASSMIKKSVNSLRSVKNQNSQSPKNNQSDLSQANQSFQFAYNTSNSQIANNRQESISKIPKSSNQIGDSANNLCMTLEIKKNEIVKHSQNPQNIDDFKPMSTQMKQSKQFLFNQQQKGGVKAASSNKQSSQQIIKKRSSNRSSRSNSVKKEQINIQPVSNKKRLTEQNAHSKKPQRQILLKNNFMCITDQANAYDGDVSSIYQQPKKKPQSAALNNKLELNIKGSQATIEQDIEFGIIQNIQDFAVGGVQVENSNFCEYETFQHYPQNQQILNFYQNSNNYINSSMKYLQYQNQQQEVQMNFQNIQEIDQMKRELRNKDLLIQNLKERLLSLEDKVSSIQREEVRDKSQQRIKDAIANLEYKLEVFHKEREENNQKLQEIRLHGSSLHSSSRQSEENTNRNNDLRRSQQLQNEIEELESLITIVDGDDFLLQKSIRTPVFEDLDKVAGEDDLKILAQDGDIYSDGQQDNSCLMMLEKEWQEQQLQNTSNLNSNHDHSELIGQFDQSKNIVFFQNDNDTTYEEDEINKIAMGVRTKDKFIKTQKIEFSKDKVMADIIPDNLVGMSGKIRNAINNSNGDVKTTGNHKRKGSFSKTLSKTTLLNKIRQAINKNNDGKDNTTDKNQKKTPRRFIVKRSQEREGNANIQTTQSLIAKQKITMVKNQEQIINQEEILRSMISQKEKVAVTQKEALKKERELSQKLRQAIQKINFKVQTQAKQPQQLTIDINK